MMQERPTIERLTDEQIAHLQSMTADEKWQGVAEINRRVRAEIEKVIRSEVPYYTDEQVHDAVCGQFRKRHTEFARQKLPVWFNNSLTIHGIDVTIPAETEYGPNWKEIYTPL